ncbi:unnamed protein product [Penicillium glandicola]
MLPSLDFYRAVRNLCKLTDQPSEEHSYRNTPPTQSAKHLLKAEDEMQLADDIAFLAQWQEGVKYVTAVTLQEKAHGLVICLASNHTPSNKTVGELNEIMALMTKYASEEMQQIAHYVNHPHDPTPRFIGCSKSACYLCDMFIQKHSCYRISHAHRQLYHQWTFPDLDDSTSREAQQLQLILKSMTKEITAMATEFQSSLQPPKPYGAQSIAFLPLTSGSTASNTSIATQQPSMSQTSTLSSLKSDYDTRIVPTGLSRNRCDSPSIKSSTASYLLLNQDDLPYSINIKDIKYDFLLQIDAIFLDIEFVTPGRLSIRHAMENSPPREVIDMCGLSTISETKVVHSPSPSPMQLCLRHPSGFTIILDFVQDKDDFIPT